MGPHPRPAQSVGMAGTGRAAAHQPGRPQQGDSPGRFLERLAETGASGIGIGVGTAGPPLSARTARRADELAFPLLSVPYSVPFTAVARAVADANGREESRLLGRVARLYELLRISVLAGRPGPETFRRLGEEPGVRLYLVDPETGLSLFGDGETTSSPRRWWPATPPTGTRSPACCGGRSRPPRRARRPRRRGPRAHPTVLVAEPVGGELPSLVLLHTSRPAGR